MVASLVETTCSFILILTNKKTKKITSQVELTVSDVVCRIDTASLWADFQTTPPVTNYPFQPEGICFNWRMGRFLCGKCNFTSNLFHLFWSNYQPCCLWLVDYLSPASLAASPDRHIAISHLTSWTQAPRMSARQWWGPLRSLGHHGLQKGFILSLGNWFDGNTDTELNHRDIIPAKYTDIIYSLYPPDNN